MELAHHAHRMMDGPGGPIHFGPWGLVGFVVPLLLLVGLIVAGVWAVQRLTTRGGASAGPATPVAASPARADPALDELRLRYARGEIGREEFLQRTGDLGG